MAKQRAADKEIISLLDSSEGTEEEQEEEEEKPPPKRGRKAAPARKPPVSKVRTAQHSTAHSTFSPPTSFCVGSSGSECGGLAAALPQAVPRGVLAFASSQSSQQQQPAREQAKPNTQRQLPVSEQHALLRASRPEPKDGAPEGADKRLRLLPVLAGTGAGPCGGKRSRGDAAPEGHATTSAADLAAHQPTKGKHE